MFFRLSVLLLLALEVLPSSISDVDKLYTKLLTGYNKNIRPPKDQSLTHINSSFNLVSIKDFDEVSGKFVITGVYTGVWYDDRLSWNPLDYNMTFSITILQDKIWKPTMFLANIFKFPKRVGHAYLLTRVLYNGTVIWSYPDVFTGSCEADVTYFPFDQQTCRLEFIAFGTLASEVRFNSVKSEADTPFFREHSSWILEKTRTESYYIDIHSMFDIYITMRRRPLFLLVNILSPVIFLTLLNSFVFLLPAESGERISYSLTVLLSLAVCMTMVTGYLPKTSKTMSILCYFLAGDLMLSSIICLLTMFQLRIFHKNDKKYPVPKCFRKILNISKYRRQQTKDQQKLLKHKEEGSIMLEKKNTDDMLYNPDVTWQEVAKCVDIINLIIIFSFQIIMITAFFVAVN